MVETTKLFGQHPLSLNTFFEFRGEATVPEKGESDPVVLDG
jgi:hypothetical protein